MMTKDPVRRIDACSLVKLLDDDSSGKARNSKVCLNRKWTLLRSTLCFIYKALAPKIDKKKESILIRFFRKSKNSGLLK